MAIRRYRGKVIHVACPHEAIPEARPPSCGPVGAPQEQIALTRDSAQMLNQACNEMESIQKEMSFKDFRWDADPLDDINITITTPINCDGYTLLEQMDLLQEVPNVGRCDDPFDKNITDDRCPE